ncbi:xanthine dehydrogenase family protein subunit M [Roseovarius spongiae]|uniref:Xanthine dehydrogenase family protein subunit M n=1 Tax=Roseovarius spongiae TaxID=2320272 RepID=A0A3A8ATU4_9RHOB|nr:xanthine dehydrogenase family protein subunit M [Roseovarius spongiae]RKF15039.1 xanthine dehydrogenase family protein subunit M [Roseovarius spongiae]
MQYLKPQSIEEAADILSRNAGKARILAGGTDLLVQLKSGMIEPEMIVDIKHLDGMHDITEEDGGYRVGAAVPGIKLGQHAGVKALWPGVVEACELIGSTQIQGRCTMVGNLCNGGPAADSVPAMVAADATVRIAGPNGARDCAVFDVPTGPGKISLEPGEFVTSVFLPARPARASDAYLRFIPRTEMDIAVASAGVSLELGEDGTITAARVTLGAVGPKVMLVENAARAIIGTTLDDDAAEALAAACRDAASPIDDKRGTVEFRTQVAGVLAKRAARIAMTRAGEK